MSNCKLLPRNFEKQYPKAVRAEGVYVVDEDGRRLLDASAGAVVCSIGHGRPEIAEALARQVKQVDYVHSSQFTTDALARLTDELSHWLPTEEEWYFFPCSGGSEAVESALKLARQYHFEGGEPSRSRFVSRRTSYHGATLGALSASGLTGRRAPYEALIRQEEYPKIDLPVHGGDGSDARQLSELLAGQPEGSCAAFIAEPVSGASAPAVQAGTDYYRLVREACDEYGLLFIADEVMCGLGRCGTKFALDKWGTVPDIIVVGKGLGAGYVPAAGILARSHVYERLSRGSRQFIHGFTYSGHPLSAAVCTEVLRILREERLVENSSDVGEYLLDGLRGLLERHDAVGAVRGAGLLLGVDIVDPATGEAFASPGNSYALARVAYEEGLNTYPGSGAVDGHLGDHLLLGPPLTLSRAEADELVEKLDRSLTQFVAAGGLA